MWSSYFIIACRSLAKQRLFTALNVIGLAIGMAACVYVLMWARNELSYNRWIPQADRVFAVQSIAKYPGREKEIWPHSAVVMLPKLAQDFSVIDAHTRILPLSRATRLGDRIESQSMMAVDSGFFDVFALPTLAGDTSKVLTAPHQLAVTEAFVKRWFTDVSSANPAAAVGKTLTMVIRGERKTVTVAAVLKDLPANTNLKFEAVTLLVEKDIEQLDGITDNWGAFSTFSFVKLKSATDQATIAAGADQFVNKHASQFATETSDFYYRPFLTPLVDLHLNSPARGGTFKPKGDRTLVNSLVATGTLILLIAMVTYVNLATARVSVRAKEVGLRKTLGAKGRDLIAQFLVESCVIAAIAGLVALCLIELSLPLLNKISATALVLQYIGWQGVLLPLLVLVAVVGVAGGWYPALVMSRVRPQQALAGQRSASSAGGWLRTLLVVAQFAVAVLLMTCVAVIYLQTQHMRKSNLGYAPEGLLIVRGINLAQAKAAQDSLVEQIRRLPGTEHVTRAMLDPSTQGLIRRRVDIEGISAKQPQFVMNAVDWGYVKTYGGRLLAGRDLDVKYANDDANPDSEILVKRGVNALVNRSALNVYEVKDPAAVIGKTFKLAGPDGAIVLTIVGVVEDIRIRSMRDPTEPAFFIRTVDDSNSISIRFAGIAPKDYVASVERVWKQLLPDSVFNPKLADDAIAEYYKVEEQRGQLFATFAIIAISLCALGVYGLAVFTAERRTKEIGIRKVLGARIRDIVQMLLMQFSKPVFVALVIAWPLAWWLMSDWLSKFDSRIGLSPWPFLASGAAALLIACLTVTWHSVKVARQSPVVALRWE
jgi:putative ABC transport system permease protein